ncbi:MAG: hypothetical protein JJ971_09040 [Balneolaceae bacterium]|nr:hypothetical protein [Balneolaceae bacterium]MBO6546613.1 hypothetical protein [Balneolaceae bacterium]MBO6648971.1 hypothetical protein [Balneolaceae bacterium]
MKRNFFKALVNTLVLFLFPTVFFGSKILAQSSEPVQVAFIIGQKEIKTINVLTKGSVPVIIEENSKEITIESMKGGDGLFTLYTKENLDFTKTYSVKTKGSETVARPHWKTIDELYTYDGELGILFYEDEIEFKLWAPLASEVILNIYEDGQDDSPSDTISLYKGEKGVWSVKLLEEIYGKFYTYSVTNYGETKEALDPYAKSLAVTTRENFFNPKGAIVNPSAIGPDLDFASIEGFEKREDAIIWEVHVSDFTSDPNIKTEAPFGTYNAFTERLEYIKNLGVTHIQLLPVLSYTYSDELYRNPDRTEYKLGANYNWGYGPDNYFSPDGIYSIDPTDPELRIKELKELVNAIHKAGMGVTLDVVYNHTAKLTFLEDIVPGYYHFMDAEGTPKESYGGGRPGSTHAMTRKLIIDSIKFWTSEYKVDGFRYDLMGDLDGETIQMTFDEAQKINPDVHMVGECWRTYAGDDGDQVVSADQDWMNQTNSVSCFSDEIRDELKSGHGIEGEPRFLTGGARSVETIFNSIIAKPENMTEDDPGDVLQYVAVHDGLTLHDMIALSIKKDPKNHQLEIHKRIRLANTMVLTSQGVAFLHAGQEYGRTKQWFSSIPPEREFIKGEGFEYPYLIRNSYDASEAVNKFNWDKVTNEGIHKRTMEYTRGLIALRKSTDAFRLGTEELIQQNVSLVESPEIGEEDLAIIYKTESTTGETYFVIINADSSERSFSMAYDLTNAVVLVDSDEAGISKVTELSGIRIESGKVIVDPLTAVVIKSE